VLKAAGTVAVWGQGTYGQTNLPAGLTNVVAIADGRRHSLALKSDGTLVAWGSNQYGQTNVPFGLTNIIGMVAGCWHNLVLQNDGSPRLLVQPYSRMANVGLHGDVVRHGGRDFPDHLPMAIQRNQHRGRDQRHAGVEQPAGV
jgi:hypothetical protein